MAELHELFGAGAIVFVVAAALGVAGVDLAARLGLLDPTTRVAPARVLPWVAASLSLGAAVIHFSVVEAHLAEWLPFALFFITAGWAQALWAAAVLLRPGRRLYLAGAAGNAIIAATWLASRTTGLPIAPEPWTPEPVGLPDLLATAFEVALLLVCLRAAVSPGAGAPGRPARDAWSWAAFSIALVVLSTSLVMVGFGAAPHA
ncbi:MAG TPA: hypothetical protein VFK38_00775 [Candidatus Limnocylindrales bacterium]|nr:hypothetical protein [Candidatus Limnocylindrales bacterium]